MSDLRNAEGDDERLPVARFMAVGSEALTVLARVMAVSREEAERLSQVFLDMYPHFRSLGRISESEPDWGDTLAVLTLGLEADSETELAVTQLRHEQLLREWQRDVFGSRHRPSTKYRNGQQGYRSPRQQESYWRQRR